jgi:hypothetical protein
MPVRIACNWIYAHLIGGMTAEERETFDGELWAPPEGWDAFEAEQWRRLDEAANEAVEVDR